MPKTKKQKTGAPSEPPGLPSAGIPVLPLSAWGTRENSANAQLGFCKLPLELTTEILSYFPSVGPLTSVGTGSGAPILPARYLERPHVLRSLSQTCVAYRNLFLPILWENLDACVEDKEGKEQFFRHSGETLTRKCKGLLETQELAAMVRTVNVVLTRYKPDEVLPAFTNCLQAMSNLQTLHILHAHTQMTTKIREGFEGVTLPTVRNLIIPGYCHELLKCCPEARSVRCTRDDGSKLVTVIKKSCKKVEEMRGFVLNSINLTKRLVAAAPNLKTLEIRTFYAKDDAIINTLKGLKNLSTIDILLERDSNDNELKPVIAKLKQILKASPAQDRKYLRLLSRECNMQGGHASFESIPMD
ncbi:hypothetical protein BKA70DRAFT_1417857 [Coprinopsis sp. MPI-PUGE-AT-0042]|nr:hypothetical protein BKA70DRAFT_1417857 [Coprinopsis sp. MPI-PUGE-AT-0042]